MPTLLDSNQNRMTDGGAMTVKGVVVRKHLAAECNRPNGRSALAPSASLNTGQPGAQPPLAPGLDE